MVVVDLSATSFLILCKYLLVLLLFLEIYNFLIIDTITHNFVTVYLIFASEVALNRE